MPSTTERPPKDRSIFRRYQTWTVDLIKSLWGNPATAPRTPLPMAWGEPGLILAYDMGSGKTISVLTALRELLDEFVIRKVLVVAPLLVAQTTWPDEIADWLHTQALRCTLLRVEDDDPALIAYEKSAYDQARMLGATAADARKSAGAAATAFKYRQLANLAVEDTEIHIINRQAAVWLWEHFGANWPYDVIVVDEPPFKNGKKRVDRKKKDDGTTSGGGLTQFGALLKARRLASKVILLTGTPTPKGLQNLWGLSCFVDFGRRLGSSRSAFLLRWFNVNQYSRKITAKDHAFDEITGLVRDIMFSLDPADLAQLPPIRNNFVRVRLPAKAMEEYRRFKRDMVSDEYDVEAVNGGVLHGKLLQFANGSMYREDGDDVFIHDAKIDALKQIAEETEGRPLLVFYTFQFDLDRIRKKFPRAVVLNESDPRETVRRWNEGRIDMLLAHRASAGHGLNLQYGSNHMVEYGLTADLELYLQARKRLQRPGQGQTIFNHVIMAEGTIDEDIMPMYLNPKEEVQQRVLEAVMVSMS